MSVSFLFTSKVEAARPVPPAKGSPCVESDTGLGATLLLVVRKDRGEARGAGGTVCRRGPRRGPCSARIWHIIKKEHIHLLFSIMNNSPNLPKKTMKERMLATDPDLVGKILLIIGIVIFLVIFLVWQAGVKLFGIARDTAARVGGGSSLRKRKQRISAPPLKTDPSPRRI